MRRDSKNHQVIALIASAILFLAPMPSQADGNVQHEVSLSGAWQVSLDSLTTFQPITLPGTTDMARLGTPNELQPALGRPQLSHLTRWYNYVGAAFYKRYIDIPKSMEGKPLVLTLERVLWQSALWIDGVKMSQEEESLTTPHQYTIPAGLKTGRHEIMLRIDNRKRYDISYNEMAHAYTDETQTKWNGVLGRMELKAMPHVRILRTDVFPNIKDQSVKVRCILVRSKASKRKAMLSLQVDSLPRIDVSVRMDKDTIEVERTYAIGAGMRLWDEFSPNLYHLTATCRTGKEQDSLSTTFGMREVCGNGKLTINGKRVFLRGTLECCVFPLAGCPPTDDVGWEKVFVAAKSWGLNHLRFHSYCPPDAAFRVADRMGFYLQVELPVWSLNIGKSDEVEAFMYKEFERISHAYGNHPSLCLMTCGNELQSDFTFLNGLVRHMKATDPRRLYSATTFTFEKGHGGHPEPEDEFLVTQWTDRGWVRGQGVFDAEVPNFRKDYRQSADSINIPLISHEIGQYSVYPNLKEIDKYTGVLAPLNFEAVRNDLLRKGLVNKAEDYLQSSGRLAALLYKEEMERAMKTPQMSGFQLLGLQDFPGQGTALVGLVDAFWESKGVADTTFIRQACAPVVPLARFEKATWSANELFGATIEVANYYKEDIKGKRVLWSITDSSLQSTDGTNPIIASGVLPYETITQGGTTLLGDIKADLNSITCASQLDLCVSIEGTPWRNSWKIWVYPTHQELVSNGILVTQDVKEALAALAKGKRVLLSPPKEQLQGLEGKFLPVFWSPVHFPKQAGTMGLLIDAKHPALRLFPTNTHSDWQWWKLVKSSKALVVDSLPKFDPIVGSVDNFTNNRRLASIFEATIGKGKLLFSSMDLLSDEAKAFPEVRQLLYSIHAYMTSDSFSPKVKLTEGQVKSLLTNLPTTL